ncbi:MAG: pyridoxal-phosphate dependent enzyme [Candidatus Promineifilaceae bacterium]
MSQLKPGDVAPVALRLKDIVNRTPVMSSRTLNAQSGNTVFLKCENFQRVGAFKFRGAYNAISQLNQSEKDAGVVTHSSGNHAQGVALAAKLLGVKAVVVMPVDAPMIKRKATAQYGAEIVPCQAIQREEVANKLVERHGYTLLHPYDNDNIILGQGTAAWELFEETGHLDYLFVPVGGGGLISGSSLSAAAMSPGCKVVGVEPSLADDAKRSWESGQLVELAQVPDTIADGLRPRQVGQRNLDIMREHVSDMITVEEEDIVSTLVFIWERMKIIVEPSAAVALAPIFTGQYTVQAKRVGVLISGGNIDLLNLPIGLRELIVDI